MTAAKALLTAAGSTIEWAHDTLDLSYEAVGSAVGAHRRSVHRWLAGEVVPSPRHRRGLERLRVLRHLLESVFETEEDAQAWLHRSVPMLRGRTPISLVEDGRTEAVVEVLAGLEAGAFV